MCQRPLDQAEEEAQTDIHGTLSRNSYVLKMKHGWYGGGCYQRDIIDTIDAGISKWHLLIVEVYED